MHTTNTIHKWNSWPWLTQCVSSFYLPIFFSVGINCSKREKKVCMKILNLFHCIYYVCCYPDIDSYMGFISIVHELSPCHNLTSSLWVIKTCNSVKKEVRWYSIVVIIIASLWGIVKKPRSAKITSDVQLFRTVKWVSWA